jgi:predicted RNA-binding protein YlqC (UPF0109 family)
VTGAARVIEAVAAVLVDRPEAVEVHEVVEQNATRVTIACDPDDIGKLIGRQGRTVAAIRTLAELSNDEEERRVLIDFLD